MMNPVSDSHAAAQAGHEAQPIAHKPPQPAQQKASWPEDKVTIKSRGGDADHDGDHK